MVMVSTPIKSASIDLLMQELNNVATNVVVTDNLGNEAKTVKTYEAPVTGTIVTERKFTDENPIYKVNYYGKCKLKLKMGNELNSKGLCSSLKRLRKRGNVKGH